MGPAQAGTHVYAPSWHALHPSQATAAAPGHTAAGTVTNHVKAEAVRPADKCIQFPPCITVPETLKHAGSAHELAPTP